MEKEPLNKVRKKILILSGSALLFLAMLSACNKSGVNCVENTGTIIRQERQVTNFDSIDIRDYVNLILTQDSVKKVTVEAGENIISGITTKVVNGELRIRNTNTCNWLRSYSKPVNVYVSTYGLRKIYYIASGNVTSTNTIRGDTLSVVVEEGCGSINLALDIYQGFFVLQKGTADFNLHGHCGISSIYSGDLGFFQCKNLQTGYTFITNSGSNDIYVNVAYELGVTINSIGNIYYTGNPAKVTAKINGTGRLIAF